MSSSNGVEKMVPLFDGRDFRLWQEKMSDYLKSQRLWRYANGVNTRPVPAIAAAPTAVELAAMNLWDETDEQVLGILALRLSPNLRTHLGTAAAVPSTSAQVWTSLNNTFGQPGISAIFADFNQAQNVRISGTQNPQVEIQRLHTLLERLSANQVVIPDYIQGMMLLGAIPARWDNVAAIYLQNTQVMANVTFASVRAAIIAEFERTSRPATLAANKISAVKRKGKSPSFTEQRNYSNSKPFKAPQDNDRNDRPNKRGKRGGKGKGKKEHSHIVSSALIPPTVANRLQESHRLQTPPQAVPLAPSTVVGGPSRAPITAVPVNLASFRPSGVTYTKVKPSTPQQYHGRNNGPGPFTHGKSDPSSYSKAVAASRASLGPTPAEASATALAENHRRYRQFVEQTDAYQNAIASTSKIVEVPEVEQDLLARMTTPTPEDYRRADERVKRQRKRGGKKGKGKEKAVAKSAEFVEDSEEEPRTRWAHTAKGPTETVTVHTQEPLDWGTDSANDDQSDVDDDIADAAGISRGYIDPTGFGADDKDNNPGSHAYDDYGYHRYVSNQKHSQSTDEKQQLLVALSSLDSRIEILDFHSAQCVKCKKGNNKKDHTIEILADSGASLTFTNDRSDLSEYETIDDNELIVQTASKSNPLRVRGKGAVFISHFVEIRGKQVEKISRLYPVFYIPGLSIRLLSIGSLLNQGLLLRGSSAQLEFRTHDSNRIEIVCKPHTPGQTTFWLEARLTPPQSLLAKSTVMTIDYDIMHRRFAHPSKDVLRHASGNTQNFPSNLTFPKENPVCPGCAEGKMTSSSFPDSLSRSDKPFGKIHMDLKSLPVRSYHGYNFYIIFFDDCTSHGWIQHLKLKSDADAAIRQFIAMVKTKYNAGIVEVMIDAGGEFKSRELTTFLKEQGISILTSVPHMHQQNGRAERFIRTIMDKAQAIRFDACLPQSWWEFAVNYATHVYNRTPLKRLNWKTPFEKLERRKPDVSHLRVFGCGAYVFLPEDVRPNKLAPKAELMTFIGLLEGTKGYIFMRSPNNVVFTAVQALFDETLFPKCPDMRRPGYTPVGIPPVDQQGEYNIPPEDENDDRGGGGDVPNISGPPPPPVNPQQPPAPWNQPFPYGNPPSPSSPGSPFPDEDPFVPQKGKQPQHFPAEGDEWADPNPPIRPLKEITWQRDPKTGGYYIPGTTRPKTPPFWRDPFTGGLTPRGQQRPVADRSPPSPTPIRHSPEHGELGPRRTTRTRVPTQRPGNVYGQRNPADILGDSRQDIPQEFLEENSDDIYMPESGQPGPSGAQHERSDSPRDPTESYEMAKMMQEGGVRLINFLLRAAVSSAEASGKIPNVKNVREWHYKDLMRLSEAARKEWKTACLEELEALRKRNVFKLTDLPKGRKVIGCRWVFDVKSDGRKKARLVAQGFSQVEGIDFNELFSPVVRFESVRLMFALAALEGWYMTGVDVRTAYLYGKLDEEIYMRQPQGFVVRGQESKVIKLQRALYGLKQAGLAWWKELSRSMTDLGFKRLFSDAGIFCCHERGKLIIAIVYVDDAMFFGKDKELVNKKKKLFMDKWECRDLGEVKEFLRMRVTRDGKDIRLDQTAYLKTVLERFNMVNAKSHPTPLPTGWSPKENKEKATPRDIADYQCMIGSLLYLMLGTRPDISFAVTQLSQFAANPSRDHIDKAKYILHYLVGSQDYSLRYSHKSGKGLVAYTDSDWAADTIKRRSVTGIFFKLADGIVSWRSHAQKTVALSSTEAEYMALSDCSRQAVWIRTLLTELGITLKATPVYGDNQGSIFIASNPVQESRTKHIDIRYHYIRECTEKKEVELMFIPGTENPADMFTKNLGRILFYKFRSQLGLEFKSS